MTETDWDNMPILLRPKDVMKLGIKRDQTYEIFHSRAFPVIKQGRAMYVEKTAFRDWLERKGINEPKK